MKHVILALVLAVMACRANVPTAQPTATPEPTVHVSPVKSVPTEKVLPLSARVTAMPAPRTCVVTSEALNVRACGGVECAAIGWLRMGEVVTSTQVITGWVYTGGGWINSVYCKERK